MWCTSAQPASARRPETRWRFHLSRCPVFGVHFCHPNIGHIYGLEEAEGQKALVLELIEGQELLERVPVE